MAPDSGSDYVTTGLSYCVTHRKQVKPLSPCCTWADCGHQPRCAIKALVVRAEPSGRTEATDGR